MKAITNGIIFFGFLMIFGIIYLYASQGTGHTPMRNSVAFAKRDPNDTLRTRSNTHSSSGGVYIHHSGGTSGTTIRSNGGNGSSGSASFRSGSRSGRGK